MGYPPSNTIITWVFYAIFIYGFMALAFLFVSDSVLFQPPYSTYQDNKEIIKIPLKEGGEISAVYLVNPSAKYTILLSHGNAEDLGSLYPFILEFYHRGYSILAYDYEGYGTSRGRTSEQKTYRDILAAYDFLTITKKIRSDNIILFGRSVGSGPSIYLASKFPARALILQSPFVSAFRVMTKVTIFPFDKYPNLKRLSKIDIPLLIIHGKKDSVIPIWHGKKLLEAAATRGVKQHYWVENADHNDLIVVAGESYWQAIDHFVQTLDEKESIESKKS